MNIFSLGAPSWFVEAINSLWLMICKVIYVFIGFLYRVFDQVARVNLFSTEVFEELTGRIYIIMGIAMLFIFAYNLVLMIINPDDKKGTGAMTKIVKETMISLIVVILLPTIFNYMYTFQNHILSSNIIGQLIMGGIGNSGTSCAEDDYECNCDFSKFDELSKYSGYHNGWIFKYKTGTALDEKGLLKAACEYYRSDKLSDSTRGAYSIAPTIFSAFYRPANFNYSECADYLATNSSTKITSDKDKQICINYYYDVNMSKYTGDIKPFVGDDYLNAIISDSKDSSMEFDWLWAILAGGLAVWMFLCYAMEIGVRVAKLGVLQIISPITVMMRIVPGQKEKIYNKWFKNLMDTYLDVFIRLLIIFFSLFAISLVQDVIETMWSSLWSDMETAGDFFVKTLSTVIVILGILKFAQEAPELIKDFFGSGGKFALRSPKKQLADNKTLQAGISRAKGIAGGVSALATTKANQFKHLKENWNRDDATFGSKYRQVRDLASMKAFKSGYASTKDAKTLDDWGYNVKKSAVDTLKDKGFIYSATHTLSDLSDDLGNISNKNYFGQDTRGLQAKADAMELIAKEAKLIISKIEDDAKFKGVVGAFDSAIEAANNSGRADLVDKITDAKIKALADMRNSLLIEKLQGREAKVKYEVDTEGVTRAIVSNLDEVTKGINRELTTAVDNLNSSLSDNFERFSSEIKDSNIELGVKFGESMSENLETLQKGIEGGNAKLVKNIKTVSEDIVASAKAEIINMEKKDAKK